jgi:hypothetical protein
LSEAANERVDALHGLLLPMVKAVAAQLSAQAIANKARSSSDSAAAGLVPSTEAALQQVPPVGLNLQTASERLCYSSMAGLWCSVNLRRSLRRLLFENNVRIVHQDRYLAKRWVAG